MDKKSKIQGMVYAEYALVTLILVVLLFLPIPGVGYSAIAVVMRSIGSFYEISSYLISLP